MNKIFIYLSLIFLLTQGCYRMKASKGGGQIKNIPSRTIDFSRSNDFGYQDQAFVAEFGDMSPKTGKVEYPVGFKIVRVDVNKGVIYDFAVNNGKRNGPATWLGKGGLERPVSVKFDPIGKELYVVDFGIVKMTNQGPQPQTGTGVIWRITKE